MIPLERRARDERAMEELGARLARVLKGGDVVYLRGPLGAGKTTFVRGGLRALGVEGTVKSPTYTLLEVYETRVGTVYHFDLYRLREPQELEFLGARDYLRSAGICLVEWPERAESVLPESDVDVCIHINDHARVVVYRANNDRGAALLTEAARE